jgi:hypothetical protein
MRKTVAAIAVLGVAAGFACGAIVPADAAAGCTAATLTGNYAGTEQDWSDGIVAEGIYRFDGSGQITGSRIYVLTGTPAKHEKVSGKYTVMLDCAVSIMLHYQGTPVSEYYISNGVIVNNGQKIDAILTYNPVGPEYAEKLVFEAVQ